MVRKEYRFASFIYLKEQLESNTRVMSSQELPQTFEQNEQKLQTAQDNLQPPAGVTQTAVMIYKQAYDNDLYHGRPINDILSACLHLACRMEQTPCNPSNVATEFETTRQNVLKTSRHFESKLGLKTAPVDPAGFINDFSSSLSLSDQTRSTAHEIFETFVNAGLDSGKSPTGLAAGAIYAATKETNDRVTQRDLAEVADVSEVTIRTIYKQQQETYTNNKSEPTTSEPVSDSAEPAQPPTPN